MPGTSKAKNPRGIDIEFTEATHAYSSIVDGHHLKYVSGTSFLSRFFPQFDPTGAIAERCAKREGITAEEMRERWAAKGRESTHLGTRLHELCEDVILGNSIRNSPESPSEMKRFTNGKKLAEKLKNTIDILGVEKIVFSHRLPTPIAGTIDLLGRSRKDGSYLILDWKTNKEIERDNKYSKFCLDPIKHIPDTALHHYALQLSLYQYLLKFEGYVEKDAKFKMALLHITEDISEIIIVPDYTAEVKDLIIWNECKFRN